MKNTVNNLKLKVMKRVSYQVSIPGLLLKHTFSIVFIILLFLQTSLNAQYYNSGRVNENTEYEIINVFDEDCPEELNLNGDDSGNKTYEAKNIISTTNILPNSDITYKATTRIDLNTGFFASSEENTLFLAELSDDICTPEVAVEDLTSTRDSEKLNVYPNPFKESTTLYFNITGNSHVSLKIYDINGNLNDVLIHNVRLEKGSYEIKYEGSHLASGLYYVVLNGSTIQSAKFIVTD